MIPKTDYVAEQKQANSTKPSSDLSDGIELSSTEDAPKSSTHEVLNNETDSTMQLLSPKTQEQSSPCTNRQIGSPSSWTVDNDRTFSTAQCSVSFTQVPQETSNMEHLRNVNKIVSTSSPPSIRPEIGEICTLSDDLNNEPVSTSPSERNQQIIDEIQVLHCKIILSKYAISYTLT